MPTQSWSIRTVDSLIRQYPLLSDHPYLSDCWNYESGCLLLAIARLYERTGSQGYLAYIQKISMLMSPITVQFAAIIWMITIWIRSIKARCCCFFINKQERTNT